MDGDYMSQKIILFGIIMILAVGAGVWALVNNSNQVPTVNITATDSNSTTGSSNSANTAASSNSNNQKTSTSSSKTTTSGSNSSSSGSGGSSSGGSSGSSSSGSSGGWVNVVPSTDNSHSETTG